VLDDQFHQHDARIMPMHRKRSMARLPGCQRFHLRLISVPLA
jgi:hypothetical protein